MARPPSQAVAAMAVIAREASKLFIKARKALRLAECDVYHIQKSVAVQLNFYNNLWDIRNSMEYQIYYHMRDESPHEMAPGEVRIMFTRTLEHHMQILARFSRRSLSGALALVLDTFLSPVTWDLLLDITGKVVFSLRKQGLADEVKVESAKDNLAVCRIGFEQARILRRGLKCCTKGC